MNNYSVRINIKHNAFDAVNSFQGKSEDEVKGMFPKSLKPQVRLMNHVLGEVPEDAIRVEALIDGQWGKVPFGFSGKVSAVSFEGPVETKNNGSMIAPIALGPNCSCHHRLCPMASALHRTSQRFGVANGRYFKQ